MKDLSESIIFPKGEPVGHDHFKGDAWLTRLSKAEGWNCSISNVTFSPGCRNNWHLHPGGQILLVTAGSGWYQEEGKEPEKLSEGSVIRIPADKRHWHGAAKDSWLVHIAISTNFDRGPANWQEPVDDDLYDSL